MELEIFLHRVDVIEDVVDNSGDYTLLGRVVDDAFHGVRLTAGSLTVRKYGAIISAQNI